MKNVFNELNFRVILHLLVVFLTEANRKANFRSARKAKVDHVPGVISWKSGLNSSIGFQLSEISEGYDIIKIVTPDQDPAFPLCYPRRFQESVDAAIVSHIICRQMGYTSYESMREKRISFDLDSERILPSSLGCIGNEHSISQCKWDINFNRYCDGLLAIKCAGCSKEIRDVRGILQNPGYPHFFPYSVLCEWKIVVPAENVIELTVTYFSLPNKEYSNCGIEAPHLELIYGEQDSYSMQRFCKLENGRNITIPYSKAKIRLFTGMNTRSVYEDDFGVNIKFRAIPFPKDSIPLVLPILIVTILCLSLIVLCVTIFVSIKCCSKRERSEIGSMCNPPPPNAPRNSDLLQAFEFRRVSLRNKVQKEEICNKESTSSKLFSVFRDNYDSSSSHPPSISAPQQSQRFPKRSVSLTTPRSIFPGMYRKGNKRRAEFTARVLKPKTNLLAKFSRGDSESKGSRKSSDGSIFLPLGYPSFEIYHSASSEASPEGELKIENPDKTFTIVNLSRSPGDRRRFSNLPSIVIHHVDDYAESVPME